MVRHKQEGKDRRAELIPERTTHTKKKIGHFWYVYTCPDDLTITFRYKGETVFFSIRSLNGLQERVPKMG